MLFAISAIVYIQISYLTVITFVFSQYFFQFHNVFAVILNTMGFMLKIFKHLHGLSHRNNHFELSGFLYI